MGFAIPEARPNRLLWLSVTTLGVVVLAVIADKWTNSEYDAWKHGYHDCKEGIPPSNGEEYEHDEECERYYEGFWEALQRITGAR